MKKNHAIMFFAAFMIGALVFVTWAKIALSHWIVGHSGVEDMMMREGRRSEMFFKDAFSHLGSVILVAEVVAGGVLLWLLWRKLYRR